MFSSLLVCKCVYYFVCLLATLRENAWTDFHEIFRICWAGYQEQSGKFGVLVCLTLCRQGFFLYVFKEIRVCEHYGKTNKRITGFDTEACWPLNGPLFSSLNPLYSLMVVGVTGPPRVLQAISSVMEFHDFFLGNIGHETKNTLEHFRDLADNPLNPGSIFPFSGSVFVSNITGKRMNGFLWNFHHMSGTTQEVII